MNPHRDHRNYFAVHQNNVEGPLVENLNKVKGYFMNMRKKIIVLTACLFVNFQALADPKEDTERLLNWAELTFPSIFSTSATTIEVELPASSGDLAGNLLYRGYPGEIFAGVSNGTNVYVLGGPWPQLTFVDTLANIIPTLPPEPNSTTPGNGNCVTRSVFPDKDIAISRQIDSRGTILNEQTIITEATSTSSAFELTIEDSGSPIKAQTDIRYENGFVFISKITSISGNGTSDTGNTITTSFAPAKQKIFSPACEGQSVKYNYVSTTQTTVPEIDQDTFVNVQVSETQLIEAINESKTIQAGTFNTVRERITNNKDDSFAFLWVDIPTGVVIAQEFYSKGDKTRFDEPRVDEQDFAEPKVTSEVTQLTP